MGPEGTVIITGGNGFVGRHLVNELKQEWPKIELIIWDLPAVDITQPETYQDKLTKLKPDWLVHLAAIAPVPQAIKNPGLTHLVNVEATKYLLARVQRLSPKTKVLTVSSADIYGFSSNIPIKELPLSAAKPRNPYAQSKWEMEKIIEEEFIDFVLRVRPFPHIGPGQGQGFVTADFASQIAEIESRFTPLAKGARGILRIGNLTAQRDFTDVRDVVRAYRLLMEKGTIGEVYHIASGRAVLIQDVLNKLLHLAKIDIRVEQDQQRLRPSDISIAIGNAAKLSRLTAWQPRITLDESLRDILNWWRASINSNING